MLSYIDGDTEIQRGDGLNLRFSSTPSEQRYVKLIWPWREEGVPKQISNPLCPLPNRGPILSSELASLPKQTQNSKSSQEVPDGVESLREKEPPALGASEGALCGREGQWEGRILLGMEPPTRPFLREWLLPLLHYLWWSRAKRSH